jgi:hypothetical protein
MIRERGQIMSAKDNNESNLENTLPLEMGSRI